MSIKQYKNRKIAPKRYQWDLEAILKGKKIESLISEYEKLSKELIKVKDSKYESETKFLNALKKEDKQMEVYFKIYNYLSNHINGDIANPKWNKLNQDFNFLLHNLSQQMGAETPKIFKNEKNIKKWLQKPSFAPYRVTYEEIFRTKKHQLPKQIQDYLVESARGRISSADIFSILTDTELDYGHAVSSKGAKIKITTANRAKLSRNKDAKVRKTASINYQKSYLKHKESLSNMLFQHFKSEVSEAKVTKFNNIIDYLVFDDHSSEKLLLSLYESVQKNNKIFKDYWTIHKKIYKKKFKENMTPYDSNIPLVVAKTEYTIKEQEKLVLNALKPFGKEYIDVVKKAFAEGWIDYLPIDNKRSGAYSIGASYGLDKKYILMNNDGTLRSASTLAHEMGHSMHSYFADKNNKIRNSQYKIFVAEIASIFNELMLYDHLLSTSKNDKLKFSIRQEMATGFEATVNRQTAWSNYEYDLYKAIEEGKPASTYDAISRIYHNNSLKYSWKKEKYNPKKQYGSIMVPHYYYSFYVYKYAIGQLVANIFFQRYKEQGTKALQDYIEKFLSVGGSLNPIATLKNAGVDLEDPKTYEMGFKPAIENNKELAKLAKKIFKI